MPFHITYLRRLDQDRTEEIQRQYLRSNTIAIGQGTGCDIVIDDVRVSLLHATIAKVDTGYLLKDVPDANGTYVNGKLIQSHLLATYDTIQIGSSVFLVCSSSPAEPLALQIEHPLPEPLTGAEAPVAYRQNLRLPSGLVTKWWLTILSLLAVMGIAAMAWSFRTLLAPGPVSQAHSGIEHDCVQCHRTAGQPVADATCTRCHDGPQHHLHQAFTPSCVTCHVEHRGRQAVLKVVDDRLCTQCHAALQARGVEPGAALRVVGADGLAVYSLTSGHPEFAVHVGSERVRLSDQAHLRDVAQMQLNHAKHLQPDLSKPDGGVETLTCSSCHQADAQGAYMRPIAYGEHCMRCHLLEFDARFPRQTVPHGQQPEAMQQFLRDNFTRRCLDRLGQAPLPPREGQPDAGQQLRPGQPDPRAEAETVVRCGDAGVEGAEKRLYTGGKQAICGLCHTLQKPSPQSSSPGSQLPVVVKPEMPARWFPHSKFEHRAHIRAIPSASLAQNKNPCEACHRPDLAASTSTQTTDVLLPGIAVCQECHASAREGRAACVTCHTYHDYTRSKRDVPQPVDKRFISPGGQ